MCFVYQNTDAAVDLQNLLTTITIKVKAHQLWQFDIYTNNHITNWSCLSNKLKIGTCYNVMFQREMSSNT